MMLGEYLYQIFRTWKFLECSFARSESYYQCKFLTENTKIQIKTQIQSIKYFFLILIPFPVQVLYKDQKQKQYNLLFNMVQNRTQNQAVFDANVASHEIVNATAEKNDTPASASDAEKRQPGVTGKKQWPVRIGSFLLFAATVAIVYVFGMRNNEVSNRYYLYVTPPGFFFTIWAVIFAIKAIVNIINLILNVWTVQAHIFLAINNLLLILWTNIFNIGNDPAVYVSFLIIFALIPTTLLFWYRLGDIKPVDWFTYFARNTYAFYLGWVVAATNVNFGVLIVYWWKADPRAQLIIFWVMAPLSAIGITAFNIYKQGLYGLKSCFALWISVTWAFVGAAMTSARCYENGCMAPM